MRKVLTVIPARGGSKGLPRKNILMLGDIPLIAWAIEKTRMLNLSNCIVSTDDEEIATVAQKHGGQVPFLRPGEISGDQATLLQVNRHALHYFDDIGVYFDAVLTIHVTTPLISPQIVLEVINTFHSQKAECVATVTKIRHGHPLQAKRLLSDGTLQDFIPSSKGIQRYSRHQREDLYYPNCGVYIRDRCLVEEMDRSTNGLGHSPIAVIVPPEQSIDIDDSFDFMLANSIVQTHSHWRIAK